MLCEKGSGNLLHVVTKACRGTGVPELFPLLALSQKWPSYLAPGANRLPQVSCLLPFSQYLSFYTQPIYVQFRYISLFKIPTYSTISLILIDYLYFVYLLIILNLAVLLRFSQLPACWILLGMLDTACSLSYLRVTQMIFVLTINYYDLFI